MTAHPATAIACRDARQQRGAVLVISLLILLVMTVLGVAAMGSTTLQERMANNNRQQQVAFQAAEAALRTAEGFLRTTITDLNALTVNFNSTAPVTGMYAARAPVTGMATYPLPASFDIYDDNDWLGAGTVTVNSVTSVARPPRYIIEYMGRIGPAPPTDYSNQSPDVRQYSFRITAIGWGEGTSPSARYLVQSTYRAPL